MASDIIPATAAPQQPGLRAFIICDRLPEGCVAVPVANRWMEPHLAPGEWAIIDPTDREPDHDEVFAIAWHPGDAPRVMVTKFMHQLNCWAVAGTRPAFAHDAGEVRHLEGGCVGDLGYNRQQMRDVIIGRVVGILEPSFSERVPSIA